MKTIKLKGAYIKVYDSIDELPIDRFRDFNRYVLIDSMVGSDVDALNTRIATIKQLIANDDKEKAGVELANMQMCIQFVLQNLSPKLNAFFAMVHSINNEELHDVSEENIERVIKKLSKKGLTMTKVKTWIDQFKKKVESEFEVYFPEMSDSSKLKNLSAQIKKRAHLVISEILGGEATDKIKRIDKMLFDQYQPKQFVGKNGEEVKIIKSFEELSLLITKYIGRDAKKMNTLEFYQALAIIQKQK